IFLSISVNDSNYLRLRPIFVLDVLLDVSFDAQLGSPATQTSFCHYGNPWRTGGNAIISKTALPPNTLAPTTSRDRTRSQSISLLATSFEFGTCAPAFFVRRRRHPPAGRSTWLRQCHAGLLRRKKSDQARRDRGPSA